MAANHVVPTRLGVDHRHRERAERAIERDRNLHVAERLKAERGRESSRRVDGEHQHALVEVGGGCDTERGSEVVLPTPPGPQTMIIRESRSIACTRESSGEVDSVMPHHRDAT